MTSVLTRYQAIELAREVLSGHARSYVSAAHALAQFLVDEEAEKRVTTADVPTPSLPHRHPTLPLPFEDPSPPRGPSALPAPLDSEAAEALESSGSPSGFEEGMGSSSPSVLPPPKPEPSVGVRRRMVGAARGEEETGVRARLPTTSSGLKRPAPQDEDRPREVVPAAGFCLAHGYRNCAVCNRGGGVA